jgi:hypothetical protein
MSTELGRLRRVREVANQLDEAVAIADEVSWRCAA